MEYALAAGLLGELLEVAAIDVVDGMLYARLPQVSKDPKKPAADPRPQEQTLAYLYDQIASEPASSAMWLAALRRKSMHLVVGRFERDRRAQVARAEAARAEAARRAEADAAAVAGRDDRASLLPREAPLRRPALAPELPLPVVAANPDQAWAVLSTRLARGPEYDEDSPMTRAQVFTVAVALAVGLDRHLLQGSPTAERYARALIGDLSVPYALLVAEVRAALGSDVLAP